jgi:protein SCO1/2
MRPMLSRSLGFGGLLAVSASAGLLFQHAHAPRGGDVPRYSHAPLFTLVDQAGRQVSQDAFAGRIWIADFIFTRCAGQCPLMTAQMQRLAEDFRVEPSVVLISFTVDPTYDTPAVLARYAAASGASSDRWSFLTGDDQAIQRLSQNGFHLAMGADGSPEEPITHSRRLVLVDQRGVIRGYYDAGEPQALAQLRHDVRRLLRGSS